MSDLGEDLRGIVGGRTYERLHKAFGMRTAEDALRHYPRRYLTRGQLSDLASLRVDDDVTVMARVAGVKARWGRPRGGKRTHVLEVIVTDGSGQLSLTFFNQAFRERQLSLGRLGLFSGRVGEFRGKRQLSHPALLLLPDDADEVDPEAVAAFARSVIPIYPAAAGSPSWRIASAIGMVLPLVDGAADPIPERIRLRRGLPGIAEAFRSVHTPESIEAVEPALRRLRWEEAFVLQCLLLQRRAAARAQTALPRREVPGGLVAKLDQALPFRLTEGQAAVAEEIRTDMAHEHPMTRLLQGEVGSGKTVVALRAMLAAVDSGAQAALLAPTEVLAAQHHRGIVELLGPMAEKGTLTAAEGGTSVVLLTGSQTTAERRAALLQIANGDAGIVVGTHALISEKVDFFDLGLVVIDEQHRFGVEQRAQLLDKAHPGTRPHLLVMTATPIPRTVAMTVFGDLDVSTLRELPAGRAPITTHVVPARDRPAYLTRTWERVKEEVASGHQVYIVCPRIEASEEQEASDRPADYPPTAAVPAMAFLQQGPLAGLRIGLLHGKLSPGEKDAVMSAFAAGPASPDGIDVLVSTTVVEVGVDVPNATMMVILDADRFGVSSLHQLRGRVGRGEAAGLCLLVTGLGPDAPARERLAAVAATTDGFELSRIDLAARREGDVLGASQSGRSNSLRLLSVLEDEDVIAEAREDAEALLAEDPALTRHAGLREAMRRAAERDETEFLEKT